MNAHLVKECAKKDLFKQCKRCKESIRLDEYEAHTSANKCLPHKSPIQANRCPLCHKDVPPGEKGWKEHLMKKKCPNNERTNPQGEIEGGAVSVDGAETPAKKPVAKSKLVNAAMNKRVEAIKEEDEDGGGHDGVGDSQVLPKKNEPSKPKDYVEP